jgi:thioredoxin 2
LTLDDRGVVVPCASCGTANRLRYGAVDRKTRCGKCQAMLAPPAAPELAKAARTLTGHALVVKVNTDAAPELGERFRIRSIPTLAVFRDGREVTRVAGARPAADIEALVAGRAHA